MSSGKAVKWGEWEWREDYQVWRRQRKDRRTGVYHEEFCDADGNPVSMQQPDVSALTQGLAAATLAEEPPAAIPDSSAYDYGPSLGAGYGQPAAAEAYGVEAQYGTSPPKPKTTQSSKYGSTYKQSTRPGTHKTSGRTRGGQQQFDPFYSSATSSGQSHQEQAPEPLADYPSTYTEGAADATTVDPSIPGAIYGSTPQAYSLGDFQGQGWAHSAYGQPQAPQQKTKTSKTTKHGGQDAYSGQSKRQDPVVPTEPVIASTQQAYASGYGDPSYGQPEPSQPAAPEEVASTDPGADYQSVTPPADYTTTSPYSTSAGGDWYGQDPSATYGTSPYGDAYSSTDAYSAAYSSAYQPTGDEDPRSRTPTQRTSTQEVPRGPRMPDHRGTSSQSGDPDELDIRFVVEPSWRFETGKVFKILWSEPIGAQATSSENRIQRNQWGDQFYICFRRFIVAKSDEGHSTCVPILTYEGRACTKRGVKSDKHGIVYALGSRPQKVKGEPDLGFPPVRMTLEAEGEKLAHTSRVNYSKFQTIEHNMKVFFIGKLVHSDLEIFMDAIESCWTKKKGGGRHHRHR